MNSGKKPKLLIIGLDSACFDVIGPMLEAGRLPNLSELISNGVHGDLESTIHPLTPIAWSSFLSGQNPGKHGIFDFFRRVDDSYRFRLVSANERVGLDFVDLVSDAGLKVASLNVPMTYPPRPINGAIVSGMGTPNLQVEFTYPPELKKLLLSRCPGYLIAPPYDKGRDVIASALMRMTEALTDAGTLLIDEYDPDLFLMIYQATDVVLHLFWRDYFKPGVEGTQDEFINIVPRIYEIADTGIGVLREKLGRDVPVLIISDHGAQELELVVGLNRFLAEKGYLKFHDSVITSPGQGAKKLIRSMLRSFIMRSVRMLPQDLKENIKKFIPGISTRLVELWNVPDMSAVDFARSRAYGVGSYGGIFLNVKGREPLGIVEPGKQYDELRDEISKALLDWVDEEGKNVVKAVERRENLYSGPFLDRAPDLIVRLRKNCFTRTSFAPEKEPLYEKGTHAMVGQKYQSIHAMYGICTASGYPYAKSESKLSGAGITDVAPTILHTLGLKIPSDMDGKPLSQIFDPDWYASNPPQYTGISSSKPPSATSQLTDEEEEKLKSELQGLGYIS